MKNNIAASSFRRLSSNFSDPLPADASTRPTATGSEINAGPKKLEAVTAADVQRVAQTYLVKENQATALVYAQGRLGPVGRGRRPRRRPGAGPPDDQAVAPARSPPRPTPRSSRRSIEKMEAQSAQVPPEMKKGFDLLVAKAKERLAELEKAGEEVRSGR